MSEIFAGNGDVVVGVVSTELEVTEGERVTVCVEIDFQASGFIALSSFPLTLTVVLEYLTAGMHGYKVKCF